MTRGIFTASVRIFPWGNSSVSALELLNYGSRSPLGVGSEAAVGRLSCSETCGIFVTPLGIKPVFPALQVDSLLSEPPEKPFYNSVWSRAKRNSRN